MALLIAFASVYVIWGSTYLGIRFAVETLPPFTMAGARFLLAGALLYGWASLRGAPRPDRRAWTAAAVVGGLLLLGGNGLVTWAEQRGLLSGVAALLVATEPLWIVILNWLRPRGASSTRGSVGGVVLGFAGVALLLGPSAFSQAESVQLLGAGAVILAALTWAVGSLYAIGAPLPASGAQAAGMQMLAGGALLSATGLATGEWGRLDPGAVSLSSALAFGYLTIFGSIVAFSAYGWLLKNTTPTRASTYAYVNPVVAVFLGWALKDEKVTTYTLLATVTIVGAVAWITVSQRKPDTPPSPEATRDVGEISVAGMTVTERGARAEG